MFPGEDVIELADIGDLKPEHVYDTLVSKCILEFASPRHGSENL